MQRLSLNLRKIGRRFASTEATSTSKFPPLEKMMTKEAYEARHHALGTISFWKKFNYFITLPGLILVALYALPQEFAHIKHLQEHPNELVPFNYLRKRKIPWGDGDHSLFCNPMCNPDPKPEE
ncbi:Cytochrome c oxidase subunit 6A1, mitochondrial [Clydaea vesicula]|uniref:Cytochrome c oxidase subunit 6A1, mitochondrial n=1 Tax=Clydaea vesicula TaxID=447962 RepID=A0AAD5U9T7_9FUNG|nr:Cytochrome c oxidase subunit 6A1, mitochondrial [Clydaea vesicula]KAJ3397075.1 Cytochrome c oxidase subunit 6A1, mitochondrial [Lobulomyces angularis]